MYKKKIRKEISFLDGPTLFRKKKEFKLTIQKQKKRLHELLLVTAGKRMDIYSKVCCCLDFFLVAVCFFHFMVCAIFMDSSKVGK